MSSRKLCKIGKKLSSKLLYFATIILFETLLQTVVVLAFTFHEHCEMVVDMTACLLCSVYILQKPGVSLVDFCLELKLERSMLCSLVFC
jgi:hypothetical protein